jgi:hypothetical protein
MSLTFIAPSTCKSLRILTRTSEANRLQHLHALFRIDEQEIAAHGGLSRQYDKTVMSIRIADTINHRLQARLRARPPRLHRVVPAKSETSVSVAKIANTVPGRLAAPAPSSKILSIRAIQRKPEPRNSRLS